MKITTLKAVYTVKKKSNKDDNTISVWVFRNKEKMPLFGTRWSANTKPSEVAQWVKTNIDKSEQPKQINLVKIFNL